MNNITLIGMPGAGKSSIGVVLAKVLGYQFIDSDLLIQKEEKRTLSEIIEQDGIDGFKAVENRVNASIQVENTVIATGGSVVYCDEAMQHLKSEGVVVYLKISLKLLSKRLGNLKDRGVVLKEGQTLESLYEERTVLYEKYANLFSEGMSMEQKIDALYDLAVEKYNDNQSAEIFGLNKVDPTNPEGKTYKELYWNKNSLTDPHNPLKIFMTYHILDRMFASTDKFINCWGFNTAYASPTEWINTMLDFSSMKLEKVYSTTDPEVEYPREFYINHSEASEYNSNERVRGSRVTVPDADNFSLLSLIHI